MTEQYLAAQKNAQDRTFITCSKECTQQNIDYLLKGMYRTEHYILNSKILLNISNKYVKRLWTDRETNGSKQILEVH